MVRFTVASINPNGWSVATKISFGLSSPNGDRSTSRWWRLGIASVVSGACGHAARAPPPRRDRRLAHRVQRMLHRPALVRGERGEERVADRIAGGEGGRAVAVAP